MGGFQPGKRVLNGYNAGLGKGAGPLSWGVPELKTIIGGTQMEWHPSLLQKRIRMLAQRSSFLRYVGHPERKDILDEVVETMMRTYGWFWHESCWIHDVINFRFTLQETLELRSCKKIAHQI